MSRDKQIEEMAKHCHFYEDGNCNLCEELWVECDAKCDMCEFAKQLYNAGYRKASDIFEEIEEKIKLALKINKEEKDKMINSFYSLSLNLLSRLNSKIELLQAASDFIAELKKKYTEGEG